MGRCVSAAIGASAEACSGSLLGWALREEWLAIIIVSDTGMRKDSSEAVEEVDNPSLIVTQYFRSILRV